MIWGELSYTCNMGRVVLDYGGSCLGLNWGRLSWGDLSLVRVVCDSITAALTFFLSFPLLSRPLSEALPGVGLPRLSSGVLLLGLDLYLPGSAFFGAARCGPPLIYCGEGLCDKR